MITNIKLFSDFISNLVFLLPLISYQNRGERKNVYLTNGINILIHSHLYGEKGIKIVFFYNNQHLLE